METRNVDLMRAGRESLKGKWGLAILVFVVFTIIVSAVSAIPKAGSIISLIIAGPFVLGVTIFSLSISRNQEAKFEQIFVGFNNFGKAVGAYLLMVLFIFLWSLLLIIPGIIAALSYSMVFYVLTDSISLSPKEALEKSKKMMYGYKWKFFRLQLRFFGLSLLCLLTLGIGFIWLIPYMQITFAKFYDDLKEKNEKPQEVAEENLASAV
ncbi:MAG: DUF975 family protein [Candidatus Pacebacteria bacterium]|nr:DUF975 family protein [Candidatus Paceibacterota bacterium]